MSNNSAKCLFIVLFITLFIIPILFANEARAGAVNAGDRVKIYDRYGQKTEGSLGYVGRDSIQVNLGISKHVLIAKADIKKLYRGERGGKKHMLAGAGFGFFTGTMARLLFGSDNAEIENVVVPCVLGAIGGVAICSAMYFYKQVPLYNAWPETEDDRAMLRIKSRPTIGFRISFNI